jgi:hypothetical protein
MKKFVIAIVLLGFLIASSACRHLGKGGVQGSGVRKTETRDLAPFKSIQTAGSYDVSITCQQAQRFEIEGDDNILPLIKTEVRDGVLHIHTDSGYNATKAVVVRVAVPDLERFSSAGADNVQIDKLKNDKLTLSSSGAAKMKASGATKSVDITSNGAGLIDTVTLLAERGKVTVAGAGNVEVFASQQLDVSVSGIGNVTYYGNPPVVNKSVSGIGSVNKGGN